MGNIQQVEATPYVIALSRDGGQILSVDVTGIGGWAEYFSDRTGMPGPSVLLRIGWATPLADAALDVREVRFVLPDGVVGFPSASLRDVPVARIIAAINQPEHREHLADLVAPYNAVEWQPPGGLRYRIRPDATRTRGPRLRVKTPDGYRKPDEFYRQVAERFLWLAATGDRPAQELAEANDVPVTTVHRWVREARSRGLLRLPEDDVARMDLAASLTFAGDQPRALSVGDRVRTRAGDGEIVAVYPDVAIVAIDGLPRRRPGSAGERHGTNTVPFRHNDLERIEAPDRHKRGK